MGKILNILTFVIIFTITLVFSSCKDSNSTSEEDITANKPELLVYCGITMIRPMTEICSIIEQQENCKVIITKGGSGNLLSSILKNQKGDLYFPGSDVYFKTINDRQPDIIEKTAYVGHNKAVIFVQKGNPHGITNDLNNLKNNEYGVLIGNANSGSIGKEAKKILDKAGIYEDVVKNTIALTTDSKDLAKSIINKEADLVINWYAVYTWDDNSEYMDVIEIDPKFATPKKLAIGLLSLSEHKDIANKILALAESDQGKAIFKKYGLNFD